MAEGRGQKQLGVMVLVLEFRLGSKKRLSKAELKINRLQI
jgi:hypothetical protein